MGRDKILWLRNRQGEAEDQEHGPSPGPLGSTLGLGGVLGSFQPSSHLTCSCGCHGAQLSCACTRPALFADQGGRREKRRLRPEPVCETAMSAPEQCLILLPLASARLHSMQKLPWGTLWRLKRWHLGLLQPHQHLPAGLANLCRLLPLAGSCLFEDSVSAPALLSYSLLNHFNRV